MRAEALSSALSGVISNFFPKGGCALDLGCGEGSVTKRVADRVNLDVVGLDPRASTSIGYRKLVSGYGHFLPFSDSVFDAVIMTSVFEHFKPEYRMQSIKEIFRVLKNRGILVGQVPNMYFPVELHSGLPFQQYLPRKMGDAYLHVKYPKAVVSDWYRVSLGELNKLAVISGFRSGFSWRHNYPDGAIPRAMRWAYPFLSIIPIGYIFCFIKK